MLTVMQISSSTTPSLMGSVRTNADSWLEYQLSNWANWKSVGGLPRGLPKRSTEGCYSYRSEHDFDDACARMDRQNAATTDVVLDDLRKRHPEARCAIEDVYLRVMWPPSTATPSFPADDLGQLLVHGKAYLKSELRRRGVWLGE